MTWKKLGRALLYPPAAVMLLLLPAAAAAVLCAMHYLDSNHPVACVTYALAAYTLTVWCMQAPRLVRALRTFKRDNRLARRWFGDAHLRVTAALTGSLLWNAAYGLFQLVLGVYHATFWYYSTACYYLLLALMRLFLLRHARRHSAGAAMRAELVRYRACGVILLVMNLALSVMIFFMVYWDRAYHHHEITTIAMAAYTFTSLTLAIVGTVRYRRYQSPVYSASKAISLASACVSMLTLEATMLTTFGGDGMGHAAQRIMLGTSGGAVSIFIIAMAVYMIVRGGQQLKTTEETSHGTQ